ncbi:MAG: Na+/H+ antiporter subunit E [Alphaproteobacteria bacterium]|nr:Na+/H+ antiporter subunit E [Alphaproteobacteria bacterium]
MAGAQPQQPGRALPFLIRMAVYLLFWIVLAGTDMKDMAAGIVTAAVASWLSLSLLPPGELTIRPGRAAGTFLRFLGQSLSAGVSVARIALSPAMPLKPGIMVYRTGLPPGLRRQAFMTFASLLPGTLPLGADASDAIPVHCLNEDHPVAAQLAQEEERLAALFKEGPSA